MTRSYETLLVTEHDAHVTVVQLNRPQALNAMTTRLCEEGIDFFESLALDPAGRRCLVLTGSGERAFCAGMDLKERNGMGNAAWARQHLVVERLMRSILDCPVPIVCAVNGAAYGGGCEMAACCDFIYAASHARFALPEVKLGIIPGGGGTQTISRALGERRAKELMLTGHAFSAQQAAEWGLVNAVVDGTELLARAMETAETIAANAPIATRQVKQAIARGLRMSLADGMAFEIEAYHRLVPTEDRVEGVRAFNEKRPPVFAGR